MEKRGIISNIIIIVVVILLVILLLSVPLIPIKKCEGIIIGTEYDCHINAISIVDWISKE